MQIYLLFHLIIHFFNYVIFISDTFYNPSSDDTFDVSHEAGYDLSHLDPQQREQLQEEWRRELAKVFYY